MSVTLPPVTDVLPAHRFDEARLRDYLATRMDGIGAQIEVRQFQGGQSNPTFLISSNGNRFVLRKKPPGHLLPSAHQIEREYRVIAALHGTDVPVPRAVLLCEDTDIVGTSFFIMDYVDGRVFSEPDLAGQSPEQRAGMYDSMNTTLAALHTVDWRAAGLEGFGRPENYLIRQIDRWSKQYRATVVDVADPAMENLIAWLGTHVPKDSPVGIAHGDFRLGNLLYDPVKPRVLALLDWELSTLGDPLSDVAYCCMPYHVPAGTPGVRGVGGLDLTALGIPSEQAFVESYCRRTGRGEIADWTFYVAFAFFRLAAIVQGVYARALQGNASSADALARKGRAEMLANIAWSLVTEHKA